MRALGEYVLANKGSFVADLSSAAGIAAVRTLISGADIVVSSFRPSTLQSLGLGYASLNDPRLIMAHLTPHGMRGPLAERAGNQLTVAARSGWASINGDAEREPLKPSGHQAAMCAGMAAFAGILAALHHRALHPGEGQEVDIAELDVLVAAFAPALLTSQYRAEPLGRKVGSDITTGPVPVADGYFALTISRAHFWRDAMNLLGLPDLAEDRRFDSSWYRQNHKEDYVARVQERMSTWTKAELFEELAARRVVAGPVLSMGELRANGHLAARQFWVTAPGTDTVFPGAPFKMTATPWRLRSAMPAPGWSNDGTDQTTRPTANIECESDSRGAPLAGIRAIVLTQAWAGAFCTEMLGLLGADVIQVEVRKRPDSWRGGYDAPFAPGLVDIETAKNPWNCSALYNSVNLNKRCITLDLQTTEGLDVFKQLLPFADFVVENFSPRVLGNLGLGYDAMKAINPGVILCSLSAYGHDGPWSNVPGIGGTIEPTSGMSALLGYEGGPPLNSGQMYPDAVAGYSALGALLTALHHRDRTGEGQYIDLSMQEANLAFVGDAAVEFANSGEQRSRRGNRHPEFGPHGIYPCAGQQQWVAIACESEEQWQALCQISQRHWEADRRFRTNRSRKQHEDDLDAGIRNWTRDLNRDTLVDGLVAAGVLAAPVLNAFEVATDASLRERGTVVEVDHPETGKWSQAVNPLQFSRTKARPVRHAPLLGQHGAEVLNELLGWNETQYAELVAAGISGMGPPE
jgi:crotonobetainyl-CoA:carnitine CoA-transferase CaiB-like acyl-CoA transferase